MVLATPADRRHDDLSGAVHQTASAPVAIVEGDTAAIRRVPRQDAQHAGPPQMVIVAYARTTFIDATMPATAALQDSQAHQDQLHALLLVAPLVLFVLEARATTARQGSIKAATGMVDA